MLRLVPGTVFHVIALVLVLLLLAWTGPLGTRDARIDLGGGLFLTQDGRIVGATPPHAMRLPEEDEEGAAETPPR